MIRGSRTKATPNDNPVLVRKGTDGKFYFEDTGGADDELIKELNRHLREET